MCSIIVGLPKLGRYEHLLVLGSLLFHFLPEYLWTNGLLHLGVIVALGLGGIVEGIRIP